jgi:hypothetical protein
MHRWTIGLLDVSGVPWLVVAAGLMAGCDSPRPVAAPRERQVVVSLDKLPELGDPIGPLDDERIEVAPPKGWHVPPRSSRWIIRFTPSERTRYPSIIVTGEDFEGVFNATRGNLDVLADQIAAAYETAESAAGQPTTTEPIEIGDFVGVSSRRLGRAPYGMKEIVVERLLLDTVVAGRRYTAELQTREGELETYRGYLLAVAGGMKFLRPAPAGQSQPPGADPEPVPAKEDSQ